MSFARCLIVLLMISFAMPAEARPAPQLALRGYVTDAADVIDAGAEARLTRRLAAFETRTRHQFVVVTVPTLGGERIDRYSLRLGNAWGIGRPGYNDGVMIIVAPVESKVRIEVGLGLEKALPNALCSRILSERVLPRFRQADLPGGIEAGVAAIIARLQMRQSRPSRR